ncbi:44624_t:CDS:10, partial [Gigaspora margarita]
MSEPSQASTSEEVHKITVPEETIEVAEETPSESSKAPTSIFQSLFRSARPSRESPKNVISIIDDEWSKQDIIRIVIEPHRVLHLLNEDDRNIYEEMKEWVKDHPNEGLSECIEQFGTRRLGDALAKVLYNYPFPDFIITHSDSDLKERDQPIRQMRNQKRRNFERLLLKSGLVIEQEQDAASDNVYIKLYAPFEKLCEQAEVIKLRMRLDTKNMKELRELEELMPQVKPRFAGIMKYFKHPVNLKKQAAVFKTEKIGQFEVLVDGNQVLAKRPIKSLSILNLIKAKVYLDFFPLHDGSYEHDTTIDIERLVETSFYGEPRYKISDDDRKPILASSSDNDDGERPTLYRNNVKLNKRAWLFDNWVKSFSRQPIEEIRDYFGEKVALYFSWLGHYTTWLAISSIAGILVVINGTIEGIKTGAIKRAFDGDVAGISVIWDNSLTAPFALFMSIWSVLFLQFWKRTNSSIEYDWNITEFEKEELPRPEFYGTNSEQFINFTFYKTSKKYAGELIKQKNIGCEYKNCMLELTIQLAIILIGKQIIGQFQEILIPRALAKLNKRQIVREIETLKSKYRHSGRKNTDVPQWVHDDRLSPPTGTIVEYEEMVIQFGFIALFGPAFPLAPLFAWLNNIAEIRSDAFKFIVELQRPVGFLTQDIGTWEDILNMIAFMAVLTNAIIIAFHSTWMKQQLQQIISDPDNKFELMVARLVFIMVFEHAFFLIQLFLAYIISDVPRTVRLATEREKYLVKLTMEDTYPALDEILSTNDETDSSLFDHSGELKLPKYKIDEGSLARSRSGFKYGIGDFGKSISSAGKAVGGAVTNVEEIAEDVVSGVGAAVSSMVSKNDNAVKDQQKESDSS